MEEPKPEVDALVENHGTLFLLRPVSDNAKEWIEKYLPEDRLTFGNAVVVERRYIKDIVFGMRCFGLVVRDE